MQKQITTFIKNHKTALLVAIVANLVTINLASVHAESNNTTTPNQNWNRGGDMMRKMGEMGMRGGRGIIGIITSINGNSININSTFGSTTKSYIVDATNAVIIKNNATSSIPALNVGDNIMVNGKITGTNITAKNIIDGIPPMTRKIGDKNTPIKKDKVLASGDGQPVIVGKVSSLNGNTLTITNQNNQTYTIDATNAKILKNNTASSIGNIIINDQIIAQGTINGSNITATQIIDHSEKVDTAQNQTTHTGVLNSIKSFFGKMFGW